MKAGQQLVYGEQIGWLDPGVIHEKGNAEFLRQVVRLRHALRRYFYAGEMARPPRLLGTIPRVTADWQWSGSWPVTTDALLAGAWRLPREKKLVLLLVNVSDEPVQATLDFDATRYDLPAGPLALTRIGQDGPEEDGAGAAGVSAGSLCRRAASLGMGDRRAVTMPPRTAPCAYVRFRAHGIILSRNGRWLDHAVLDSHVGPQGSPGHHC